MRFQSTSLGKTLFATLFFIAVNTSVKSQILATGDLVFTGYHASGPTTATDQFAFVPLVNLPIGTVIKFTDNAWNSTTLTFNTTESNMTFTVTGAAITAGTEIIIIPGTSTAMFTDALPAGTLVVTGTISLPTPGDQIIAYQGPDLAPTTFISGIHMNAETGGCGVTTAAIWDPASCVFPIAPNNNTSMKPAAFTTDVNAFWSTVEHDNGKFNGCGLPLGTPAQIRAAVNNPANWIYDDAGAAVAPWFPTTWSGCAFMGGPAAPVFTLQPPVTTTICAGSGTSFTIAATGASSYQWQVDNGGGFANLSNDATYSGVTTVTLTITNAGVGLNGYLYRAVATNGGGSTNSNNATLNVTALPVNPTLLAKIPATVSVADGTPVSATFNAGSGGSGGCTDDYRYTTNGGGSYTAYTPGTPISTTGLAAGTGYVFIEGRRGAGCASCPESYVVLAAWYVTPLPAAATTLNAGDIAFSGYTSAITDEFSFVLLKNIGPGTVINFTNNGWLSATSALAINEETIVWTSNAAYPAGTEIKINGTTATLALGGSAGTVTGVALDLATGGDQVLAYRTGPLTFLSGIHMNVEAGSTAAAWDGAVISTSASALPPGLTTGVNSIWIGTAGDIASEFDNARYGTCAGRGTLGPINTLRAALNNQANWIRDNLAPAGFTIPTGCLYFGLGSVPNFTLHPVASSVCEGVSTSFTTTAAGAITYQWQVDNGGGFANLSNNATYSGVTTPTLNINATPLSLNGYLYRNVATNVSGSTNSNSALLTVTALPVRPTLLSKTPASNTVADGTPVSATFNAGSGGTGCSDDYRYTIDGGTSYLPYTPGTNISTTGLAAGSGFVFIEGRRATCSAGCQGAYDVLAAWRVTPLPVAATTLNAGDIAFSGYASTVGPPDEFSFVLLRNIGPGTVINFTDNGWLSATSALAVNEQTVTWTSPAGGLPGGTEIKIAGLTATKSGGGAAGTVTGTALSLISTGDQVLAYRTGPLTFISAIHMNVEPGSTTGAWDGAVVSNNASALPPGLTSGANAIWIGTPGNPASEFSNSRYGNCSGPGLLGPLTGLRAALNNQANWISDNNTPPSFTLPTGCNYLSVLCPVITVTNPVNLTGTVNVPFSETFTSTGGAPTVTYTTASTLPTGLTLSSAGVLSGTPTQGGTFPIIVVATDGGGCTGTGATYNLVINCPAPVTGTATPSSQTVCSGTAITTIVLSGAPAGAVYNWARDNNVAVTGITATGAGDISGTLTNTTAAPVTVTFTITPVHLGCSGTPYTATVLVNPTPDVVATPSSQTICSGATITTIVLTGSVAGASYDWTRDNTVTVTGIAASGSGDISGALTNTTSAPVTVTFTITPTANGCPGTPVNATVVVNPIPDATATPSSQSRCSGQAIQPILMGGAVSGTSFNWVRDNFPTIGGTIPASGSGNISGNLINNTGAPVTVTFTITPTANGCPGTPITATVTVNPLPTASITGGNQYVCQGSDPVLTAGFDPGYTYAWGRTLFTTPFTAMGTGQTQVITASGNYLLTVTNQYGCVDTAMTVMNVADYTFNGTLAPGDAVQTGRINRFAVISTCAAPKACPGLFTTVGSRLYDSYTVTNPRNVPVCVTIGVNSFCSTNIFSVAYSGSFNPTSLCANYLADPGSSFTQAGFYEATIPANGTIVVIVHEVNTSTGCTGYTLTVDIPREAAGITATPSAAVCSGTPVTLTASTANTYVWTPGGETTQAIVVNTANTYGVTLGYGNTGCTDNASQAVTINPTPDVDPVPNQYYCAGSTTPVTSLTGTVPGTTFDWTNNNTAIGLGASGSGDIPSFTATNTTGAPITASITVTPSVGACIGTPITFTITVSNEPLITGVTDDEVCAPGGVVNLTASGNGNINWYDAPTGGIVVNSGTTYSPNITSTTTYYVESLVPPAAPVQNLGMPAQSNTFPGNVRGYWFTAPTDFVINSLSVPTTASSAGQSIAVVKFTGNTPPPVFSATTNAFTTVFFTRNNTGSANIPCNIPVQAGEVIGILGYRGTINSYAPGDYNTTIAGFPVQLQRLGMQFQLTTTDPRDIWREFGAGTSISRIEFQYSASLSCTSAPRVPVTGTVKPMPDAVATPASQSSCSGAAITTIVLSGTEPGTSYDWVRDNTGTVTGIPGSGNGDISGTLTNTTNAPITVTFTITPSVNGCIGTPITATVVVNPIPDAVAAPTSQTVCSGPITTIVITGNVAGTVFNWSRDHTVDVTGIGGSSGTGSGDISGTLTNTSNAPITVTFTIIPEANGCSGTPITATVTVNGSPTITCPANIITSNAPGLCSAPVTYTPTVTGVPVPALTYTFTGATTGVGSGSGSGSSFNVGITTVTIDATNICGGVSCSFTITVNDTENPTIICPAPVTVSCAADVPAPSGASPTAFDNCSSVTVSHISDVISGQTCANRYTITRTYRVTDAAGNFAECTQTITVNDITPPVVTCPAPVTVSCAAAVPAANISLVTATDNCAGAITITHISDVISNQTCANRFTVTRTYRATDVCGNFAECTQIITVNDVTPPVVTCPAPVTVSCAAAVPAANIALVTATDNCAGAITITHISDVISGQTCANRFIVTRTYRATDACGNFADCTQIITVNDVTPPVVTCPAPVTVSCAAAVPAANIALVTATDNCGGVITITHVGDVISGQTCANRFTVTRTYRATDVCGNFADCTQIITVNDVTPPVITCPAAVTVSCASAVPAANIALVTATDNCGGVITIVHVGDVITNQTCTNRFTVTRTYRATDVCGNTATCTQTITVNDITAPVITCPANITATTPVGVCTAIVNFTPTATDNCGAGVTIVSSPASGSAFPVGVTTVTSTATDACGNSSSCTFTVTVIDAQLPVITSQPANTSVCAGTNATFSVTATNVVSYQWEQWNGSAWVNVPGATSSTLTVPNVTINQNLSQYRVRLTGLCSVVISNSASLRVFPSATVVIVASPPAILPNETATLTAVTNNGLGSFVWFFNGNVIPGATGPSLGPLFATAAGTYRVVYTDPNGCTATSADQTLTAIISNVLLVYPNPNFGQFHVRFYNQPNERVTIRVTNDAGQLVYRKEFVTTAPYTQLDVDLGFKANGVYLVQVVDGSGNIKGAKRIIVNMR